MVFFAKLTGPYKPNIIDIKERSCQTGFETLRSAAAQNHKESVSQLIIFWFSWGDASPDNRTSERSKQNCPITDK